MSKSRTQEKFLINKKATRLILSSNYAKHNGNNPIIVHLKELGMLKREHLKKLNTDVNVIASILEACQSEWKHLPEKFKLKKDTFHSDKISCQLCDYHDIHELHVVKNKFTNEELIVGSTCITEFGYNQQSVEKSVSKLKAQQLLHEKAPNLLKYLDHYKSLNDNEYLLPLTLYNSKKQAHADLMKLVEKLYQKPSHNNITKVLAVWEDIQKIEEQIKQFHALNHSSFFYPTPKIVKWLKQNDKQFNITNLIRSERGLISKLTFLKVLEPEFIERLLTIINRKVNWIALLSSKTVTKKVQFRINYIKNKAVILELDTREFLEMFTEIIFEETINIKHIQNEILVESILSQSNSTKYIFSSYEKYFNMLGYNIIDNKFIPIDLVLHGRNDIFIKYSESLFLKEIKAIHLGMIPLDMTNLKSCLENSKFQEFDQVKWKHYIDVAKNASYEMKKKV